MTHQNHFALYDSKFIQVYIRLDDTELRWLRKWVASPAHNMHEGVTAFFEYLLSRRNGVTPRVVDKETIFSRVFPGEEYEDIRLRRLMSESLKVLEEFLAYSIYESQLTSQKTLLAAYYRQKGMEKHATKALEDARKLLTQPSVRDSSYLLDDLRIHEEQFARESTGKHPTVTNLEQLIRSQTEFHFYNTLRFACHALSYKQVLRTDYTVPILEHVLAEIATGHYTENAILMLYYHCYRCLAGIETEHDYHQLKQLLNLAQSKVLLHNEELNVVWKFGINYCVRKLNTGASHFVREAFELYRAGLDHGLIIEHQQITRFAFMNIAELGLQLKEFVWVDNFITRFGPLLDPALQHNLVEFQKARLRFERGEYEQALQGLLVVEFDDIFLILRAKVLQSKIYYELDETDVLDSHLKAFGQFIRRHKNLSYHGDMCKNFIRLTQKLLNHNFNSKSATSKLRDEVAATQPLTDKTWLLDKLG